MAMTKFPRQIGGFEILGSLGQGGMGVVYCARDHTLQRDLAIKVQTGDWQNNPERMQRFMREARILARINHPNVVQIYSVGEHEGAPFFAMELLEGSIADAARLKLPSIAQLKRWILEAARGLAAIHEMGVVHRDIKPGNLLLTRASSVEDEHVKVADLGIASAGEQFGAALTRAGAVLGTSGYLPPESFLLEHTLDSRADQYSLGVVFFELLARRPPYDDMGDRALVAAILEPRTPPDVRSFRPEVDGGTAAILTRMLQDDPDQRFENSAALVQALSMVQDTPSIQRMPAEGVAVELARSVTAKVPPPTPLPVSPALARPGPPSPPPRPPAATPAAPAANAPTQQRLVPSRSSNTALKAVAWVALALVIGLAGSYLWRTPSPAPVAASTTASSPQTESAPAVVTLGADAQALDPLQREAWAKYLLASYHLESADDDHWTLILADQDAGVIEAELSGWDDETIELSGRVDSNVTETVDGEDWDVYRVKLLGPADLVLDIRFKFSESATAGEGTLIGQGDHQEFKILSSTDL